jgi:hypothetical protein
VNFEGAIDTQASEVQLKKNRFRYKDLDLNERKQLTKNILDKFKRNVRKFQNEQLESSQSQNKPSMNGSALAGPSNIQSLLN